VAAAPEAELISSGSQLAGCDATDTEAAVPVPSGKEQQTIDVRSKFDFLEAITIGDGIDFSPSAILGVAKLHGFRRKNRELRCSDFPKKNPIYLISGVSYSCDTSWLSSYPTVSYCLPHFWFPIASVAGEETLKKNQNVNI
jgi:hypothetical protein